jgi:AcrR family transcriptional regulator
MPYPAQVDQEAIIASARQLIELEGVSRLSLGRLAAELEIKAPSLYHHVRNKADLLRMVNLATLQTLFVEIDKALAGGPADPAGKIQKLAGAYRAFAHDNPRTYMLAFSSDDEARPDEALLVQMILPVQKLMAEIAGEAQSLTALRGLLALIHGFVVLEINQQLRRGGNLDAAYQESLAAYLAGWGS